MLRFGCLILILSCTLSSACLCKSQPKTFEPAVVKEQSENLLEAASNGLFNEAVIAIALGADVNIQRQSDGRTPLILAAESGGRYNDVVTALLDAGAEVDQTDKDGNTALIRAAAYGREGLVRILLNHGAHIDAQNKDGKSALSEALESNHPIMIKFLLDNGAYIFIWANEGVEPSDFSAKCCGNPEECKFVSHDGSTALDNASWDPIKEVLCADH